MWPASETSSEFLTSRTTSLLARAALTSSKNAVPGKEITITRSLKRNREHYSHDLHDSGFFVVMKSRLTGHGYSDALACCDRVNRVPVDTLENIKLMRSRSQIDLYSVQCALYLAAASDHSEQ